MAEDNEKQNGSETAKIQVLDKLTGAPLAGVEIACIIDGGLSRPRRTDRSGLVVLKNKPKQSLQATKHGYRIYRIDEAARTIELEPLPSVWHKVFFHVRRIVTFLVVTMLIAVSVLVVVVSPSISDLSLFLFLIGGLVLWLVGFQTYNQSKHLAQVVSRCTGEPIPYAVILTQNQPITRSITNRNGFVYLPYPLPQKISLQAAGHHSSFRQTIPVTAISSDILLLPMEPEEA